MNRVSSAEDTLDKLLVLHKRLNSDEKFKKEIKDEFELDVDFVFTSCINYLNNYKNYLETVKEIEVYFDTDNN